MSTKKSHILKQTCSFCLSMCDFFVNTKRERVKYNYEYSLQFECI